MWNKNQAGFSLIEAMVSMALLAVVITLSMNFMEKQNQSRSDLTKQTLHRFIAIQVTQHITTNLPYYPPIRPPSPTSKIVYVGCLNKDGVLLSNHFKFKLASPFNERLSLSVCDLAKAHYEVRFFWVNSATGEMRINLLTYRPGKNISLAVHNFKIFAN